ncbi:translation initiation factor IF-2 N-terminal domain-containing protein, partial [Staphylococcus epidermidis]|nr:translation initiation factor IF-2 N-terminal domain-containing protein [Staphylococcus epidermidis]
MSKKRIYEYAKTLNLKSKEIIDELKSMNVEGS